MIKIEDKNIYRNGSKIGWISDNDIWNQSGDKAGYYESNDIYDHNGTKIAYLDGSYIRMENGDAPISMLDTNEHMSASGCSDIMKATVRVLLGG